MKKISGYQVFSIINILIMLLLIFVTAYPIYYVVIVSFSDPVAFSKNVDMLWLPLKPYTTHAYELVFKNALILSGFANTLFVLVVGVLVNMVLTMLGAFCLSIKGPMLNNTFAVMIIFTMYFSGGLVPGYLNIKELGLLDSRWALILPGAIGTSNLIIMLTSIRSIPDSLIESARLDGASYLQILTKIIVPLSKATMAVLVLYYGVGHWNSWFGASIYLLDSSKFPLQLVVRNILVSSIKDASENASSMTQLTVTVKYALIVVSSAPILMLYPFVQKHFTKGVMIGAIKG